MTTTPSTPLTPTMLEETSIQETHTNWCCILSTFIVAGGLCFFGVSIALRGDAKTGLVLLLSSGALLALSICAAIGKFKPREEDKITSSVPEDPEDRPPSYRLSWRRSFKRRVRLRNNEEDEEGGRTTGRKWWQRRLKQGKEEGGGGGEEEEEEEEGRRGGGGGGSRRTSRISRSSCLGYEEDNNSSTFSCHSELAGPCGGLARGGAEGGARGRAEGRARGGARGGYISEGYGQEGRCTQSLSNLLDPPSYQDALASIDEATIRKLRSEMCLPSAVTSSDLT